MDAVSAIWVAERVDFRISAKMKRRSARPFTVEVKHTRTAHASLTDATARSRSGQNLWRDLPLAVTDKPAEVQPASVVCAEPAPPVAPARRVLPSLVPMFSMPVELETPEVREAPAPERLPRVRRVKPPAKREQPAAGAIAAKPVPDELKVQRQAAPPIAAPALTQGSTIIRQPASVQARTARRTQQATALRPGERWKRRLPRVLW